MASPQDTIIRQSMFSLPDPMLSRNKRIFDKTLMIRMKSKNANWRQFTTGASTRVEQLLNIANNRKIMLTDYSEERNLIFRLG
jgi:hypothetical protein